MYIIFIIYINYIRVVEILSVLKISLLKNNKSVWKKKSNSDPCSKILQVC